MREHASTRSEKKKTSERLMKFGRDFNLVVGGVALLGSAIAPPVASLALGGYAGFQFVQAVGFEAGRRHVKKRNNKKQDHKRG